MKSAAAVALLLTMLWTSAPATALDSSYGDGHRSISAGFDFDWDWLWQYFPRNPGYPGGSNPVSPIPEPSAALIFGAGLVIAAMAVRRRS